MSSVNNLMIPCVDDMQVTHERIANVFLDQGIAKVRSVTMIPNWTGNSETGNCCWVAYILIDEWCNTEVAANFIARLKNPNVEARIVYQDDNWWPVHLNTHNNGNLQVGSYTVTFDTYYYLQKKFASASDIDDSDVESQADSDTEFDEEAAWAEFKRQLPVRSTGADLYDQILEQLRVLNHELESSERTETEVNEICSEINTLENELRIIDAANVEFPEHSAYADESCRSRQLMDCSAPSSLVWINGATEF